MSRSVRRTLGNKPVTDIEQANMAILRSKYAAEKILKAMTMRGERPCLGERTLAEPPAPENTAASSTSHQTSCASTRAEFEQLHGKFTWLSYNDAGWRALAFGLGLEKSLMSNADLSTDLRLVVGVAATNGIDAILALLGGSIKGCIMVPLAPTLSMEDICAVIQVAKLSAVICDNTTTGSWTDVICGAPSSSATDPIPLLVPLTTSRECNSQYQKMLEVLLWTRGGCPSYKAPQLASLILGFILGDFSFEGCVSIGEEGVLSAGLKTLPEVVAIAAPPTDEGEQREGEPKPLQKVNDAQQKAEKEKRITVAEQFLRCRPPKATKKSEAASIFTMVFTSGSTGTLKAATFTDDVWCERCLKTLRYSQGSCMLLHESIAWMTGYRHMFDTMMEGGQLAINRNPAHLFEDAEAVNPTFFSSVPHVFRSMKERFEHEVESRVNATRKGTAAGFAVEVKANRAAAVKAVTSRFQTAFRACGAIVVGGASSCPAILQWMREVWKDKVLDSYGTTEVGMIGKGNGDGWLTMAHTTDFRVESVPEMGYYTFNKPYGRGLLLVKTKLSANDYASKTAVQMHRSDGYISTGDIVEIQPDKKTFRIIDRLANFVKLPQGQFVTPGALGDELSSCPSVSQVFVHASAVHDFVVAVVVPNPLATQKLMANAGKCDTVSEATKWLKENPAPKRRFFNQVHDEFRREGAASGLKPFEIPKKLLLADEPFSTSNGLLTISQKPCRGGVLAVYADRLRALMDGIVEEVEEDSAMATSPSQSDTVSPSRSRTRQVATEMLSCVGVSVPDPSSDPSAFTQPMSSTLCELGVDSLQVARVQHAVAKKFHVDVPIRYLAGGRTPIGEIVAAVVEMEGVDVTSTSRGSTCKIPPSLKRKDKPASWWRAQATLPESLSTAVASFSTEAINPSSTSVVLLGATGWLGRFLIVSLLNALKGSGKTLICIIRAADKDEAVARLLSALEEACIPRGLVEEAFASNRLVVLSTMIISRPNLGLSDESFAGVLAPLPPTSVVNAASVVDYISDYEACRDGNVELVKAAIQFCLVTTKTLVGVECSYHHCSTLSVCAAVERATKQFALRRSTSSKAFGAKGTNVATAKTKSPSALVDEDLALHGPPSSWHLDAEVLNSLSGYVASKLVAEQLCDAARAQGLQVSVHRVGMIGPNTATGSCQKNNFVSRILGSAVVLNRVPAEASVPPQIAMVLNPVDAVADGMAALVLKNDRGVKCTHFANSAGGASMQRVWQWVAAELQRPSPSPEATATSSVHYREWVRLCVEASQANPETFPLAPLLDSLNRRTPNNFDTNQSDTATQKVVGPLPPVSADYIRKIVQFIKARPPEWWQGKRAETT